MMKAPSGRKRSLYVLFMTETREDIHIGKNRHREARSDVATQELTIPGVAAIADEGSALRQSPENGDSARPDALARGVEIVIEKNHARDRRFGSARRLKGWRLRIAFT
jgi:hypothetical protein